MAKTNTAVATLPTAEQYIAEYMARKLEPQNKAPKPSMLDRLARFAENAVVDAVADSKRIGGRLSAAYDAAAEGYEDAKVLETRRQAERAASRLGLV